MKIGKFYTHNNLLLILLLVILTGVISIGKFRCLAFSDVLWAKSYLSLLNNLMVIMQGFCSIEVVEFGDILSSLLVHYYVSFNF